LYIAKNLIINNMRKFLLLIFSTFLIFNNLSSVYAQCTPNVACVDTGATGEMCPLTLPVGTVGVPYSQVVTIIPPASGMVGSTTINLCAIKIKSITNLPPGLTYTTSPSNGYFAVTSPYTRYCALISGTPTTAGTYNLNIKVTPYTLIITYCTSTGTDVTDTTSLSITINNNVGIGDNSMSKNYEVNCLQNPFSNTTQIAFYSNTIEEYELKIHDMLGNIVYREKISAVIGDNVFRFTGTSLHSGMYMFSVSNKKKIITKKLIKSN
jgi:hypothetical protein